jgi:hypothetical protein
VDAAPWSMPALHRRRDRYLGAEFDSVGRRDFSEEFEVSDYEFGQFVVDDVELAC